MTVTVFHKDSKLAMLKANELADEVRKRKRTIPLRNVDGTLTGEVLHLGSVQVNPGDENIALIALQWELVNKFE